MSEYVFVLGAGASVSCGAPVMSNFIKTAESLFRNGKTVSRQDDFQFVFNSINKLAGIFSKTDVDLDNLESIFGLFEMSNLVNHFPGLSENEIGSLTNSLKRVITKTLEKSIRLPKIKDGYYAPDGYRKLVELIKEINGYHRRQVFSIVTFNYDIALDYTLELLKLRFDYCLDNPSNITSLPFLKLHGSLNWGVNYLDKKITPINARTFDPYANGHVVDYPENLELEISKYFEIQGNLGSLHPEPMIIPPTWNKSEYRGNIQNVWKRAAFELSNAENIFVMGYSYPNSDMFFHYLLAIGTFGGPRLKRFCVFDPDNSGGVNVRFQSLVSGDAKKRYNYYNFVFDYSVEVVERFIKEDYKILNS